MSNLETALRVKKGSVVENHWDWDIFVVKLSNGKPTVRNFLL
jgi:hypothetical protein